MEKLGAFFAYVVVLAGIIMVLLVPWYIYANLQNFNPNIIATIAAALIGGFFALKGYSEAKKREVSARHFIEKKNAYADFIDLLFDLIKEQKKGTPLSEEYMAESMNKFQRVLITWGSPNTISTYNKFLKNANPDNSSNILFLMDDLLHAIRKDLGHDNTKLGRGDLVGMFLDEKSKVELEELTK